MGLAGNIFLGLQEATNYGPSFTVTQNAYLGNAQYSVSVDGYQYGVLTAPPPDSFPPGINYLHVLGSWPAGTHTLEINFLNDAYGGTPDTDRNLFVRNISINGGPGTLPPEQSLSFYQAGPQSVQFVREPLVYSLGSGPDRLVLTLSQDAYVEDAYPRAGQYNSAYYTISVDGGPPSQIFTASALHSAGQHDTVTVQGDWGPGPHTVTVNFLNDAYGGTPAADRNLYVESLTYNGLAQADTKATLYDGGSRSFTFTEPVAANFTVGSGVDRLELWIAQDAYLGNAQYLVRVDGRQIGDVLTATALHSQGQHDTVGVLGNWTNGPHFVQVEFLNDAYGGTPATDRNLYVEAINYAHGYGPVQPPSELGRGNLPGEFYTASIQGWNFNDTQPNPVLGTGPDELQIFIGERVGFPLGTPYTIAIDGQQVGGELTAATTVFGNKNDSLGAPSVTVRGDWAPGLHSVTLSYPLGPELSAPGLVILRYNERYEQNFGLSAPPGGGPPGAATLYFSDLGPANTTIGSGPDRLELRIAQDFVNLDTQYTIAIDGNLVSSTMNAFALHTDGQADTLTILGDWTAGPHTLSVNFLNDLYLPNVGDRNLYVEGLTYNGVAQPGTTGTLYEAGALQLAFDDPASARTLLGEIDITGMR